MSDTATARPEYHRAQATVGAIITRGEGGAGEILLTRRRIEPFRDQWCLPGGHIDEYEPCEEAVAREVREETGLEFRGRFFGYFDEALPDLGIHNVVLIFAGRGEGELKACPEEVADIRWFSPAEARSLPLAFLHNAVLDAFFA
jgi:8-oxo-dGTP diphosphatase